MASAEWDDLMTGLTLLSKGATDSSPLHCEHDRLTVCADPSKFTQAEIDDLDTLGFHVDEEYDGGFYSFRFGSA